MGFRFLNLELYVFLCTPKIRTGQSKLICGPHLKDTPKNNQESLNFDLSLGRSTDDLQVAAQNLFYKYRFLHQMQR
jgi:hypothetical protein